MKKIISFCTLIAMISFAQAQTNKVDNSRKVSTRGFAEREVTPDIINLSISLKEYYSDGNSKKKVTIETLEEQLYKAALANAVPKENISIQNVFSYNQETKKKNNELLQARQYNLKVTDLKKLDALLDKIDAYGLQSTNISGYDHSRKKEIEKELKMEAVKDARANAEILALAADQKVGVVLGINDNSSFNWDVSPRMNMSYSLSKSSRSGMESEDTAESLLDVKPIKLSCTIDAIYELL